jgi:hypothetical protein
MYLEAMKAIYDYTEVVGEIQDVTIFGFDFDDVDTTREFIKILKQAEGSGDRLNPDDLRERLGLGVPDDAII